MWPRRSADYVRASYGRSELSFTPDVSRSFNRGFTEYFAHGRTAQPVHAFHSPKATGPEVGRAERVERRAFLFRPISPETPPLAAGDGLCFVGSSAVKNSPRNLSFDCAELPIL